MSFEDFMAKVRYWDNIAARWMMRHFYILFFEFVLVVTFFFFFFNLLKAIDIAGQVSPDNIMEQLLLTQATNTLILVLLVLLNSFWMLYIFNGLNRLRLLLKEISFSLSRRKPGHGPSDQNGN